MFGQEGCSCASAWSDIGTLTFLLLHLRYVPSIP